MLKHPASRFLTPDLPRSFGNSVVVVVCVIGGCELMKQTKEVWVWAPWPRPFRAHTTGCCGRVSQTRAAPVSRLTALKVSSITWGLFPMHISGGRGTIRRLFLTWTLRRLLDWRSCSNNDAKCWWPETLRKVIFGSYFYHSVNSVVSPAALQ